MGRGGGSVCSERRPCIRTLMQCRLFERDIDTEKFLTSGDGAQALAKSPLFRNI